MKKPKIYIAGKVTGEPLAVCTMKFGTAQQVLEAEGFEVINPLSLVNDWKTPWDKAMRICIKELMTCDGIYLIGDFMDSQGAVLELYLSKLVNIPSFRDLKALRTYYE